MSDWEKIGKKEKLGAGGEQENRRAVRKKTCNPEGWKTQACC